MKSDLIPRSITRKVLLSPLCVALAFSANSWAACTSIPTLATAPLANATTTSVLPNILFTLDDSGSMGWDFMPDWVGGSYPRSSNNALYKNAGFNVVYYNPAVTYTPPVLYNSDGTLNTSTYPSKSSGWTSVKYDAFSVQGNDVSSYPDQLCPNGSTPSGSSPNQTCNLTASGTQGQGAEYYAFIAGEYCTAVDRRTCNTQTAATTAYPIPGNLRWCSNTALTTCQATKTPTYQYARIPGAPAKATLTVTGSGSSSTSFNGISINGQQILSGASTASGTNSTVATNIASKINACTAATTGTCTIAGYSANASGSVVTITAPANSGTTATTYAAPTITKPSGTGTKTLTASSPFFSGGVPGSVAYVPILSTTSSYPLPGTAAKATTRTDCGGTTCTYSEEMTNFANWFTYYHTRMQMMKSGTSRAFKSLDNKFRVGFNTISYTGASSSDDRFLAIDKFELAQKSTWFTKLFKGNPQSSTPLRTALSKVGKLFAKKSGISGAADPVQYSCQQNFAILSTDGYWNDSGTSFSLTGGSVGNMDSAVGTRPMYEGPTASSNSLADVAKYYYDTDLRSSALSNCTGALGLDVCEDNVFVSSTDNNLKQHLTLFTVGIGADGLLNYQSDYLTATSGDYYNLKNGLGSPVVNWPDPQVSGSEGSYRIDDLWHAAVNGQGQYFSAKSPDDIVNGLNTALASISAKIGAGAAAATSTLNPVAGDNFVYVASYTTVKWYGNLEARTMNLSTGTTSTAATWCADDVVSATCSAPSALENDTSGSSNVWYCVTPSASSCSGGTMVGTSCKVEVPIGCTGTLKGKVSANSDTRTIYTNVSGGLGDFLYGSLTAAQKASLTGTGLSQWASLSAAQQTAAGGENLVKYLRGQTGYEDRASNGVDNRLYRYREAVMGDAVESQPAFEGKPTLSYTDTGYMDFVASNAGRAKTVFLGTNDGMLHAFDANNGQERWAYVPSMVIPNMWKLADKNYATMHTYYVNGNATVTDFYDGSWRTILVGNLRGGGRGYYALDVTNPAAPSLLWEFSSANDSDLGYSFGDAVITKRPSDNKWVVLVTSGYNNVSPGNGKGYLYVLDPVSGAVLSKLGTGVGSTTAPSGLAKIAVWANSPAKNNTGLYAYGGDLLGNVWRFNLSDNTIMKFAELKDSSGSAQPITTRPELAKISDKRVVYIATGKYIEACDLSTTQQHSIYAIKDDNATSTFVNPRSATSGTNKMSEQVFVNAGATRTVALSSCKAVNFTSDRGFYLNFPDLYTSPTSGISASERASVDLQLQFGTLLAPTTVPASDVCAPGGYGWANYIDYKTGCQANGATVAGTKTNAPIVGMTVVVLPGGSGGGGGACGETDCTGAPRPVLSIVTADDATPRVDNAPKFNMNSGTFRGKRAVWRELVQ